MKFIRTLVLAAALSVPIVGCAQIQKAIEIGTTSITNPVTPAVLKNVEDGLIVLFAGLNAYRDTCVKGLIPQDCVIVIRRIQVYTRQVPPYLVKVRAFVRSGDQINAVAAYNIILGLIESAKTEAALNNVRVN